MQLIGMLDSPYVRRVAISLRLLGLPFEHRPVSVFSTFEEFRRINPVVKAPSLVCDNGEVLMDSTLILDYVQSLAASGRQLVPVDAGAKLLDLRLTGLALAACEKSVQIVYERQLRPADKQHQPWLDRVCGQLLAACAGLEAEMLRHPRVVDSASITQGGVTAAVAWQFTHMLLPGQIDISTCPALDAFAARAEQLPEFLAAPARPVPAPS